MGTRSTIGIINKDGSIESIYCHWDGYPKYNGALLKQYYSDETKLRKLLALGDISSLGSEPVSDPKLWDYHVQPSRTDEGFSTVCLAYKDRGETDVDSHKFANEKEFLDYYGDDCDFNYFYDVRDGLWYCYDFGRPTSKMNIDWYLE